MMTQIESATVAKYGLIWEVSLLESESGDRRVQAVSRAAAYEPDDFGFVGERHVLSVLLDGAAEFGYQIRGKLSDVDWLGGFAISDVLPITPKAPLAKRVVRAKKKPKTD